MNIIQLQEALKDFSDDQLVREMQMPSGQAPQYLVLTELERREKSRQRYQAQQQPQQSVAEETLMTRMQGGIAPMAPQGMPGMPPQSANAPSPMQPPMAPPMQPPMQMAQGGVVKAQQGMYMGERNNMSFGDGGFSEQINQRFMPAESEQESQAIFDYLNRQKEIDRAMQERLSQSGSASMTPQESSYLGVDPRTSLISSESMYRTPGMAQGGVVKARDGMYMPSDPVLRAMMMQESGGDPFARGEAGEIGPFQILPTTAISPGYGISSLFPDLESAVARGEYPSFEAAYEANKDLIESTLQDPRKSEQFAGDYLRVARERFPDDEARAIASYNVGMAGAEKLEDPSSFPYVQGVAEKGYSPDEMRTAPSIPGISAAQASTGQTQPVAETDIGADALMLSETPEEQEAYLGLEDYKNLATLPAAFYDTAVGLPAAVMQNIYEFGKSQVTGEKPEYVHSAPAQTALHGEVPSAFRFYEGPKLGPQTEDEKARVQAQEAERKAAATDAELEAASKSFENLPVTAGGGRPTGTSDAELYDQVAEAAETPQTALEQLMDMMQQRRAMAEEQAEMDKYLALAQAGATLASSKDPTFLGALGEATQAGIGALQGSREGLADVTGDEMDVLKALTVAEATADSQSAKTQRENLDRAIEIDKIIAKMQTEIVGTPTPEQQARLSQLIADRDRFRILGGLPATGTTGASLAQTISAGVSGELAKRQQNPQQ